MKKTDIASCEFLFERISRRWQCHYFAVACGQSYRQAFHCALDGCSALGGLSKVDEQFSSIMIADFEEGLEHAQGLRVKEVLIHSRALRFEEFPCSLLHQPACHIHGQLEAA